MNGVQQHHILSVLVENKFGVLTRVAGLFARRGFNIVSLAVSPTEDERYSRMTIVVDAESAPVEQAPSTTAGPSSSGGASSGATGGATSSGGSTGWSSSGGQPGLVGGLLG